MPNRLAQEKSPYLKQHANNPVDWFPWSDEAFEKAKAENKLVFLSIGYSTCYWCHVMEKESFEREDVGAALNQGFVSVKVDREEHPEVDEIYMEALMAISGHGGWPMSVLLTPDRKPFWGGTYLPRPQFLQLLARVREVWAQSPDQILAGGDRLYRAISEGAPPPASEDISQTELFQRFRKQAESHFDSENGGFGSAPKFPSAQAIRLLLRLYQEAKAPELLEMAERSLQKMACGGIYDQLGGGFHRYSVDEHWLVPHFEKMLYDNALLVPAYLEAWQLTGKQIYSDVARETLDYLLRDMKHPGGAFFAAEDAGEVGKEGEFYVWSEAELRELLGPRLEAFREVFPLSVEGNFEHSMNVLHLPDSSRWEKSRSSELSDLRRILFQAREKRPRPHRDSKILTSWNGLLLSAFSMAYRTLGDKKYLQAAEEAAHWIKEMLGNGRKLFRRHCDGESRYSGTASDYAFLIQGLLSLYEASFNASWLLWARDLQSELDASFWNLETGGYFTASRSEAGLITRKVDRNDGAIPSPNSVSYGNLLKLAQYFLEPELDDRAGALFLAHGNVPERFPFGLASLLLGLHLRRDGGPKLLVFSGMSQEEKDHLQETLQRKFRPNLLLAAFGDSPASGIPVFQGKLAKTAMAYLCEDGTCMAPRPARLVMEEL